ncbi:MAG: N-6 DNA methylase [Candidatus Aureabacteria bacterium]|nr:N-6 DNA methylase [Candidatus Auribacterota bacterium]
MLDTDTKARIDSARDILVGKVPDPKSQVEQITIALIYKFMDDMDRQSEELGGKAAFFSGEFKRYAWNHLLDNRHSGHERLLLYAEGIEKMNTNKNIPQLFRDIFKGVFLPYRDPETLNLFLKEINGFTYDHSERLGDAFEYLLSVLGSQGEAGQFRTPRHIIDFIVSIVSPQKNETILDPACGTAGFLISSYKHILIQNTKDRPGDKLTADERGRLMTNFCGYDISPDMVRLSRVNMYLHSFANPRIHEYDTLTSEERWDERYDVILANPPFMSPKGGIRPHNRFSIKATRSEVLFVDYIAEHLNVNGRAGIIVPEGIIFQSQNAYKKLRKMLVENYLWCVVSLPGGCFNPYSGVKTSILLLDKSLAKRIDEIMFVKIGDDGFDLGAQRRPIEENDLPEALALIKKWKEGNKEVQEAQKKLAHAVSCKQLLESGDCHLSGDRYRDKGIRVSGKWPMVPIGKLCENIKNGLTPKEHRGRVVYIGLENIVSNSGELVGEFESEIKAIKSTKLRFQKNNILYGKLRPNLNKVWLADRDGICSTDIMVLRFNSILANPSLFVHILRQKIFNNKVLQGLVGAQLPRIKFSYFVSIDVPLPPLEVQEQIVAELNGYRKIIEGAKQIIANYKPTIKINSAWPIGVLKEVAEINRLTIDPGEKYGSREFCYVDISSVENGTGRVMFGNRIKGSEAPSRARRVVAKGDVLLSTVRPNLKAFACLDEVPDDAVASTGFAVLTPRANRVLSRFLWHLLFDDCVLAQMLSRMGRGAYPSINQSDVESLKVPLPPLDIQHQIVDTLESERAIVDANRKLVEMFEQKIQAKLAEIWGEE